VVEAAMNQMKPNSTSLRMFFVMFFIAFPVVVTVNLVYRNSSFGLFEGFSEGKEHRGTTQNVTTLQNVTHDNLGREGDNNSVSSSK